MVTHSVLLIFLWWCCLRQWMVLTTEGPTLSANLTAYEVHETQRLEKPMWRTALIPPLFFLLGIFF